MHGRTLVATLLSGLVVAPSALATPVLHHGDTRAPGHTRLAVGTAALRWGRVTLLPGHPAAAGAPRHPRDGGLVTVSGSRFSGLAARGPVRRVEASAPVTAFVMLRPRHASLLARLAADASAREPLSAAQVRALFYPTAPALRRLDAYLRSRGLTAQRGAGLVVEVRGPAAAAERAFNVDLVRYPTGRGRMVRVPNGPVRLPRQIAGSVTAVGGLDTALRLRPNLQQASRTVVPGTSCQDAVNGAAAQGGKTPADLATAYGYGQLAAQGSGQAIAFLEYSGYSHADVTTYLQCFSIDPAQVSDHTVGRGPSDSAGSDEVALDVEVGLSAAPAAQARVYKAANNLAAGVAVLNRIASDAAAAPITAVSNSWGLCESFVPPSILAAENTALQVLAVRGISFFSAAGDSGSADCYPWSRALVTDDPASQPFATAVGGTTLESVAPTLEQSAWRTPDDPSTAWFDGAAGGGGVSSVWPMPSWQRAQNDVQSAVDAVSSGRKCGATPTLCRAVPDVALDADPATGYIVYSGGGWQVFGGTSGAAPLLAAMTVDANQFAADQGKQPLGFASPFLYSHPDALIDVTTGGNNLFGGASYQARPGFDLATGLGSVNGLTLADDLVTDGPATSTPFDRTTLPSLLPGPTKSVTYGRAVTFSGVVRDAARRAPVAHRRVDLEVSMGGNLYAWRTTTSATGHWAIRLSTALKRNLRWRVVFTGSDSLRPAVSAWRAVHVTPRIAASLDKPRVRGRYLVRAGRAFSFRAATRPNMAGARLNLRYRFSRHARWRPLGAVTVGSKGRASARLRDGSRGLVYLRWTYAGGKHKAWLSATSATVTVLSR